MMPRNVRSKFQSDNEAFHAEASLANLIENDWEASKTGLIEMTKELKRHLRKNKSPRAQWNWFP